MREPVEFARVCRDCRACDGRPAIRRYATCDSGADLTLRMFFCRPVAAAALAAGLGISLAGCGGSSAVQTFDLTAPVDVRARGARGQFIVNEPVAVLPADSERIVIRTGPESVAYLSGAQWADRLPKLLQARLVQTYENAHLLRSVGRPGMTSDFAVVTEIRRFEVDVTTGQAVVELSVKLVADGSGRIVAAKVFSASMPSPSKGLSEMAAALDAAMGSVLRQIVGWTAGAR